MQFVLFFFVALLAVQPVFAEALERRNIPDARLLYEDASGRYYGAMMSERDLHPDAGPEDSTVLKLYVERKPGPDGRFFRAVAGEARSYTGAPIQAGIQYAPDEIARMSEHVIPAIGRVFPEWSSHPNWRGHRNPVLVGVYIDNIYLEQEDGGAAASYAAEDPVMRLSFKYSVAKKSWRPAYEVDGLLGYPVDVATTHVDEVLKRRKRLDTGEAPGRGDILAMFDRHRARNASQEARQVKASLDHMNSRRRPGIVYKSGAFWAQYRNFETPRNIIEGNFVFIAHPADFAEAYLTYVDQFYETCKTDLNGHRVSYTETWFETRYGITSKSGSFYVEMEDRFAKNYETMADTRYRRNRMEFLGALVKSTAGTDGTGPFSYFDETMSAVAADMVSEDEMARFLSNEGCTSPIVKQLADNLWRVAAGLRPVQMSEISYAGVGAESIPYTKADGERFIRKTQEARARNPKRGADGYPYLDEELVAYRTGMGLAADGRGQVDAMRKVGLELETAGYPVLYCFYGPTGVLDNGEYDTVNFAFWYEEKPPELDRLLAARTQQSEIYRGMNFARSSCPENSGQAREILADEN